LYFFDKISIAKSKLDHQWAVLSQKKASVPFQFHPQLFIKKEALWEWLFSMLIHNITGKAKF
jgi:hypothetical protein